MRLERVATRSASCLYDDGSGGFGCAVTPAGDHMNYKVADKGLPDSTAQPTLSGSGRNRQWLTIIASRSRPRMPSWLISPVTPSKSMSIFCWMLFRAVLSGAGVATSLSVAGKRALDLDASRTGAVRRHGGSPRSGARPSTAENGSALVSGSLVTG